MAVTPTREKKLRDWLTMLARLAPPIPRRREGLIISDKRAAIRELFDIVGISNTVSPMVCGLAYQLRQLIPIVGADAISDKPLSQAEKESVLVVMGKFCEKEISRKVTETFQSAEFWGHAVRALYSAYAKYYSAEEIKDIGSFYRSPAGKKYRECQAKIRNDVMDELLKRYATPSLQAIRLEVEKEIKNLTEVLR